MAFARNKTLQWVFQYLRKGGEGVLRLGSLLEFKPTQPQFNVSDDSHVVSFGTPAFILNGLMMEVSCQRRRVSVRCSKFLSSRLCGVSPDPSPYAVEKGLKKNASARALRGEGILADEQQIK